MPCEWCYNVRQVITRVGWLVNKMGDSMHVHMKRQYDVKYDIAVDRVANKCVNIASIQYQVDTTYYVQN